MRRRTRSGGSPSAHQASRITHFSAMMKLAIVLLLGAVEAFVPSFTGFFATHRLHAGGFEWEDPQQVFDQGVENPFKNPNLMDGSDGMKVDPARLLSPRLSGSNLYFIGMMGSGKTAVGDVVARRESIGQARGSALFWIKLKPNSFSSLFRFLSPTLMLSGSYAVWGN